jgi:hypothetical protein
MRTGIIIKIFLLAFIISCSVLFVQAQDPGDPFSGSGSGGGNPGGAPGGGVPVDGGLGLLLAAGVGYGVRKAYNYRKHKVKSEN